MKIIDLLNKIANGEEIPIKFTYKGYLWEYDINNKMWFYYFGESKSHRLDRLFYLSMILNDEVEILEEEKKIPEKLDLIIDEHFTNDELQAYIYETQEKVNQVIDYLDYLKNKGDE